MKKILFPFLCLLILSFILGSCKKNNNPVSSEDKDYSNYYPSGAGNYYKYYIERTNADGIKTTGTRDTRYGISSEHNGIYTLKVDSIAVGDSINIYNSFFRETDAGVYYFLDPSGFLASLPQEYAAFIPYLKIDPEMLLLSAPLYNGQTWTVFKVNIEQNIVLTVVDVEAVYLGKEDLLLNLNSGNTTKATVKIEYDFSFINPITQDNQTSTVYGWFAADIGAVKWEGDGFLLNLFTRGELNLADSSSTGIENLIDYNIK